MPEARSFVAGYFALDLDGFAAGIIQKVEGGAAEPAVATLPIAHDYYRTKQIGNVKYDEFTLQMGLSMAQPLRDWIAASLSMNYMRKSGEVKTADFKRQVREIREFKDALLSGVQFPAGDAASKEAALVTVRFVPTVVRAKPGDQSVIDNPVDVGQKVFTAASFRLLIDGVDTSRVRRVDAVGVDYDLVPGRPALERRHVTWSPLAFALPEADAKPFAEWQRAPSAPSRSGTLAWLDATRQHALLTLHFGGLAVASVAADRHRDPIGPLTRVELTYRTLHVTFG